MDWTIAAVDSFDWLLIENSKHGLPEKNKDPWEWEDAPTCMYICTCHVCMMYDVWIYGLCMSCMNVCMNVCLTTYM